VLEGYEADDLIAADGRVEGVRLIRSKVPGNGIYTFVPASAVVLATGGIGALYALTTNPSYAKGEALAMAARAGAVIADPEFVQFHPTAIDAGIDPAPLATEALRGEGAALVNSNGDRFMFAVDPRGELAPRDVVARAVYDELSAGRGVFLDCREAIGARFEKDYPTVWGHCQRAGIDPSKDLIPVAPAEHYHMGGIATDIRGRTSLIGLWAVGEVASTGLHGANRLASNSLLEAVVLGARAAADILAFLPQGRIGHFVQPRRISGSRAAEPFPRREGLERLRALMTTYVGVQRSAKGLKLALAALQDLEAAAGGDTVLSNMILTARFVTAAALMRRESRGGHYRVDYPETKPTLARRTFITIDDLDAIERVPRSAGSAATLAGCGT
jgi:L-aspartate oxidase